MVTYNSTSNYSTTSFIVNQVGGQGSYLTIQSAINAAVAAGGNQTIIVYDGTYTENLTISAGLSIASVDTECNAANVSGGVTIVGQITFNSAGQSQIIGCTINSPSASPTISINTNGALLDLISCRSTSNSGTFTSIGASGGQILLYNCNILQATTGFSLAGGLVTTVFSNISANTPFSATAGAFHPSYSTIGGATNAVVLNGTSTLTSLYSFYSSNNICINASVSTNIISVNDTFQSNTANFISSTGPVTVGSATGQGTANNVVTIGTLTYLNNYPGNIFFGLGAQTHILEGTNAVSGVATLTAGTVAVATNKVLGTSRIILTRQAPNASTAIGALSVGTVASGSGFVINALNAAAATETGDLSTVYWRIIQSV